VALVVYHPTISTQAVLTQRRGRKEREENENMNKSKGWESNLGERREGDKSLTGINKRNEGVIHSGSGLWRHGSNPSDFIKGAGGIYWPAGHVSVST
jgi:hypothetical protein